MESALYVVPVLIIVVAFLSTAIKVLREYERAVIFRLGRLIAAKGPGLVLLIPFVDKMVKVSLRTVAMDVPPQDVITRDNVSIKVNAVIFFRVLDPRKAVVQVEDYPLRDLPDRPDDAPERARSGRAGRPPGLARQDQPAAPADHRRAHGSLGGEGDDGRGQARRPAAGHAAGDVEAGRGRAGAAGEGHQRRGRVPGGGEARAGRPMCWPAPRSPSSSGFCRRCGRSPRSGTRRPSSPCPSISLRPS